MVEAPKLEAAELGSIHMEIQRQPAWRRTADMECDYYDGNQLDSATLQAMKDLGMAPIVENGMAPAIDSVLGYEVKNRLDFIITPENEEKYTDTAKAMSQKINEAERQSHLDQVCTEAFASQVKAGLGWACVGFEHNPFKYPHVAEHVHRNEMFWDMKAREADLSDARWVIRRKWYDVDQLTQVFRDKKELLESTSTAWATLNMQMMTDGGKSTDFAADFNRERAWTLLEQEWRDSYRKRMCLSEVWYRRWVTGEILRLPDGRVLEFDDQKPEHVNAVAAGIIVPEQANFTKVRLGWWVGPHCLADIANPYKHGEIPYVAFFGKREDMTGVPYGLGRPMVPMQDEINARSTKSIWLLAAKRVTMTAGVADLNETRNEAARPDAVHVLDAEKMRSGGIFKVETDFELNAQQYHSLQDKREALKNVVGIYKSFEGQNSNASSGRAIDSLVEQSSQTLATIFSNQRFARTRLGKLLLSNIIQEIGTKPVDVALKQEVGQERKRVTLNKQHEQGIDNDVQRAILHVSLSDIPSTNSYRQQQASAFAEILKSLPPQIQAQLMDFYIMSTDMPDKEQAAERLRKTLGLGDGASPQDQQAQQQMQQMQQMVQDLQKQLDGANQQLANKEGDQKLKARELDIKENDVALATRVAAENTVVKREQMALSHQHSTNQLVHSINQNNDQQGNVIADQQQGEMDDRLEIDAIVKQVEAKINPALDKILAMLADMKKEDAQEDKPEAETPKEDKLENGVEEPASM